MHWSKSVPKFQYDPDISFFDLMVPTINTCRFSSLLKLQLKFHKPVIITGYTSTGKSIIINETLETLKANGEIYPIQITFSAHTTSKHAQSSIISKL